MRGLARAAAQLDPCRNVRYPGRWTGPPPRNRRGPGRDPQAHLGKLNSATEYTTADLATSRVLVKALTRANELDRLADFMLQLGYGRQAEHLAHRAHATRDRCKRILRGWLAECSGAAG
jgi:hypothetical protein